MAKDEVRPKNTMKCNRCGEVNPAEIHTCTPLDPLLEALRVPEKKEWVGLTENNAEYERGFIDGMQKQMQSSVDKAVNSMTQPEPKPVAWGVDEGEGRCISLHDLYFVKEDADHMAELKGTHAKVVPLYTAPPQREWVGLTEHDFALFQEPYAGILRWVEATLKEKNNGD